MVLQNFEFTSESVSEGHPDKLCDQISDAILDKSLELLPYDQRQHCRVAVETAVTTNHVTLLGEVRNAISHDEMKQVVKDVVKKIGYDQRGFSWQTLDIHCLVHKQSEDIAHGVDSSTNQKGQIGAG